MSVSVIPPARFDSASSPFATGFGTCFEFSVCTLKEKSIVVTIIDYIRLLLMFIK